MKIQPEYKSANMRVYLADTANQIEGRIDELIRENVITRIWQRDHTVWKPDPKEISNRLGWLNAPQNMIPRIKEINGFCRELRDDGFKHAIVLGMGGSSLAPDVFQAVLKTKKGYLDLDVLDTTDPGAILALEKELEYDRTLFVVSTKSGGTVETLSLFKFFYTQVCLKMGQDHAGRHFCAITDPGSSLLTLANQLNFRKSFLNDPEIGGRYSALSFFGLVPAGLIGTNLDQFLKNAQTMTREARLEIERNTLKNSPSWLGAIIGHCAEMGRDKLTLFCSERLRPLTIWIEQLIAESTGKEGKGVLPVTTEPIGHYSVYGPDRFFVFLTLAQDHDLDDQIQIMANAGFPVIHLTISNPAFLGAEMFRWEIATVVACHILHINPFDQPNVESAKILGRQAVQEFKQKGGIPRLEPSFCENDIAVITTSRAKSITTALADLLDVTTGTDRGGRPYIAIQAFLKPSREIETLLRTMTEKLRDRFKLATTYGYGPRFLHSTGQLHKGDAGFGIFLQFTAHMPENIAIPDEPGRPTDTLTFAVLKDAQALGDRQALLDNKRTVIRFELTDNPEHDLDYIIRSIS
ncbi:glucose-6-phosphate isomerase [bacterium]|nr:glucose-6-phosphate isomerase [bacterium]